MLVVSQLNYYNLLYQFHKISLFMQDLLEMFEMIHFGSSDSVFALLLVWWLVTLFDNGSNIIPFHCSSFLNSLLKYNHRLFKIIDTLRKTKSNTVKDFMTKLTFFAFSEVTSTLIFFPTVLSNTVLISSTVILSISPSDLPLKTSTFCFMRVRTRSPVPSLNVTFRFCKVIFIE